MAGRRRRGGCGGCGCLILLLLLAIAVWAALVPLGLLQRLGLRPSAAERMLAGPPDESAAEEILAGLKAAGLSTQGVRLYVMPLVGSKETAAIAVLDAAQGFGAGVPDQDALLRYLDKLATGDTADRLGISRVAVSYQDAQGKAVLMLTGATKDIQSFASGQLSQEEFLKRLHANIDPGWFLKEVQSGVY
jgi:hypothetical protein